MGRGGVPFAAAATGRARFKLTDDIVWPDWTGGCGVGSPLPLDSIPHDVEAQSEPATTFCGRPRRCCGGAGGKPAGAEGGLHNPGFMVWQTTSEMLPVALWERCGRREGIGLLVLLLVILPGRPRRGTGEIGVGWQIVEAAARDGGRNAAADLVGFGAGVASGLGDAAAGRDQSAPGVSARPLRRRGETRPRWDRVTRDEEPGISTAAKGRVARLEGEAERQPALSRELTDRGFRVVRGGGREAERGGEELASSVVEGGVEHSSSGARDRTESSFVKGSPEAEVAVHLSRKAVKEVEYTLLSSGAPLVRGLVDDPCVARNWMGVDWSGGGFWVGSAKHLLPPWVPFRTGYCSVEAG